MFQFIFNGAMQLWKGQNNSELYFSFARGLLIPTKMEAEAELTFRICMIDEQFNCQNIVFKVYY